MFLNLGEVSDVEDLIERPLLYISKSHSQNVVRWVDPDYRGEDSGTNSGCFLLASLLDIAFSIKVFSGHFAILFFLPTHVVRLKKQ